MSKSVYAKIFAKRAVLSFFVMMLLFLSCVLRVAVVATGGYKQIADNQASYKIDIARLRGTIYDCNMVPLTNNCVKSVIAIAPTPQAIMQVNNKLTGENLSNVLENFKNNKPAICFTEEEFTAAGTAKTRIYMREQNSRIACHLIGYVDATGHGVAGLELAYDDFLYSEKFTSAIFTADGKGNVLKGIDPYFDNDLSVVHSGVVTTIDINIQKIVEDALEGLNSGCVVVAQASTGKIRAMASVPSYSLSSITESLNGVNSPMLNRALCAFNVGSIFKPAVAAASLQENVNFTFNCEGSSQIGDRVFKCHNLSGHGEIDLKTALAQSCNCYFYNIALHVGSAPIYKIANTLSIGNKIKIANNTFASAGNMPKISELLTDGALANFSIGQGSLMASPVAMLNLYLAIANDGCYYIPSLVEKTTKDGKEDYYDSGSKTYVMNSETALKLREYLQCVITDGTGKEAAPKKTTAAGKTATAQTGRRDENGVEITNSWFCGFFPAYNPEYVVIVLSDTKSELSTAKIFAQITDKIVEYDSKNVKNDD